MTAAELIEKLKEVPPDTPIMVEGYDSGVDDVKDLHLSARKLNSDCRAGSYAGRYTLCRDGEVSATIMAKRSADHDYEG
jgi:hypothetical protein